MTLEVQKKLISFSKPTDKTWKATFNYQQPNAGELLLSGSISGHIVQMQLKRVDEKKFLLAHRGFHWVQEYPFIR
jgi:hypothetical protein